MAAARPGKGIGAVFAALGVGMFVMMRLHPEGANAPEFVLDAAAGTFFCAGLSILGQAFGQPLLSRIAGLAVVYLLAVPGLWLLLGEDTGSCSVGIALGGLGSMAPGDPTMCRVVFGAGGIIVAAVAVVLTVAAIRERRRKPDPLS